MRSPTRIVSLLVVAGLCCGATACSAVGTAGSPTPLATTPPADGTEPSSTDRRPADPADDTCVDGFAWMQFGEGGPRDKALPDGCDTVIVNGSGATLSTGPARVIVVMGDDNTVEAVDVAQLDLMGDDNAITHHASTDPLVNTDGTGNTVTRR